MRLPQELVKVGADRLVVPFLSPPNVSWPEWLVSEWTSVGANFDNYLCTRKEDRIDFRIASRTISGECKDYSKRLDLSVLKTVLERIPDDATVHLVVTNKLQNSYFNTESISNTLFFTAFRETKDCAR